MYPSCVIAIITINLVLKDLMDINLIDNKGYYFEFPAIGPKGIAGWRREAYGHRARADSAMLKQ